MNKIFWQYFFTALAGFAVGFLCYYFVLDRGRPVQGSEQFKTEIAAKDSAIAVLQDSIFQSQGRVQELEARDSSLRLVVNRQAEQIRLINVKLYETHSKINLYTPADIRAYLQREGLPVVAQE